MRLCECLSVYNIRVCVSVRDGVNSEVTQNHAPRREPFRDSSEHLFYTIPWIKWAVCLDLTSTKGARVLATPRAQISENRKNPENAFAMSGS